jgi:hypothetical protein
MRECFYCEQSSYPVGFYALDGEWLSPFEHRQVCVPCYSALLIVPRDDETLSAVVAVLRMRIGMETQR